jgi:hypothetical protein
MISYKHCTDRDSNEKYRDVARDFNTAGPTTHALSLKKDLIVLGAFSPRVQVPEVIFHLNQNVKPNLAD